MPTKMQAMLNRTLTRRGLVAPECSSEGPMNIHGWHEQLRRGALDLAILASVAPGQTVAGGLRQGERPLYLHRARLADWKE